MAEEARMAVGEEDRMDHRQHRPPFLLLLFKRAFAKMSISTQIEQDELPRQKLLLLLLLLPLFFCVFIIFIVVIYFLLQTWIILFLLAAFASFQYGRYRYVDTLQDLNSRWKRHILYTSKQTPLEPCEWLNKLIVSMWAGYMEPTLSHKFSAMMTKRFREKRPPIFRSIEFREFYLGKCPPSLGSSRIHWSTESDKQVLKMGFEWDTMEMKILLAAKLARPFGGMAQLAINNLHIKGDIRIVSILDGQAFVYSFENTPEVRIGLTVLAGGQSLPATELIASWLEKFFQEMMTRTMVEPERICFPLAAVSMKKRATGGVICVSVILAENLKPQYERRSYTSSSGSSHGKLRMKGSGLGSAKQSANGSGSPEEGSFTRQMNTYVEVNLEGLTRSTQTVKHSGSPKWGETFHMVLHDNVGAIHFNIYEHHSTIIKDDHYGTCGVKVRYVDDGSTIFWASGENNQVLADRAECCGKEIMMEIPINTTFNGSSESKLLVKLQMKEWLFRDGSRAGADITSLQSIPSFEASTGRIVRITIVEGRNLAAKDRNGKSDPYVWLRYGKLERKTKVVKEDLNPVWEEQFEFHELVNEERLQLKCYDSDYLNDESLGSARVSLEGLEDGVQRDVWVPLERIDKGEIRLIIEAFNPETDVETPQNGSTRENDADSSGLLRVTLVEARDLIAADLRGTSDPFVNLQYGDEKRTTKIIPRTLHPQWHETFEFVDSGKPLTLCVKDHNDVLPDKQIGSCKVEYQWLPLNKMEDKWIPLQGVKKGEIHVQVTRLKPSIQNPDLKLVQESTKIRDLLREVRDMAAAAAETDAICKKIETIEMLEQEKSCHLSRLIKEKEKLLQKVNELDDIMKEMENQA